MLGVVLLYVGIVLISNGIARLSKIDPRSQSIMNLFTGGLSVIANIITIVFGEFLTCCLCAASPPPDRYSRRKRVCALA